MTEQHTEHGIQADWYKTAFGEVYPLIYAHRSVEAAAAEVRFAAEQLHLNDRDCVLDLCCGNGRHSVTLLGYTKNLVGLDYSAFLLKECVQRGIPHPPLLRADMRHLPFPSLFDAVVNFFTSFGYFQTTAENQQVLKELHRVLKPGGRFFMDYLNPDYVRDHLVPESSRSEGDYLIQETRWLSQQGARVNKATQIFKDNAQVAQTSESVRLCSQEEMRRLLGDSGLTVQEVYGDYSGAAYQAALPRMILIGCRA